jgi:hypothetical protein
MGMGMFNDEEGPFDALIESTEPMARHAALVGQLTLCMTHEEAINALASYVLAAYTWQQSRPALIGALEKFHEDYVGKVDRMADHSTAAAQLAERNVLKWTSMQAQASERGKKAAEKKHGKPGGTRDKREAIRTIWSQGKYSSRDLCAEQECAALNMSWSAARKALRNIPKPT